jgi:hypothetical protein
MLRATLFAGLVLSVAAGGPPAAAEQDGTVAVVVVAVSDAGAAAAAVQAAGGVVTHRYRNVPALAARVPATRLAALRGTAGIGSLEKDGQVVTGPVTVREGKGAEHASIAPEALGGTVERLDVRATPVKPDTYANYLLSGASAVWDATGFGAGSVVAVVDSGTAATIPCLDGAVIGAPGFPSGFDSIGDNPATATNNHPHGTWVAGTIASACTFTALDTHPLIQAVKAHAPSLVVPVSATSSQLLLLGVAPGASIYPVKVFPKGALSTATSEVLEGLDHVLTLKKSGALDVDVVNLSLGGGTLWDGRDAYDRFVDEVEKAGIVVVTSSGNSGPVPNTVGSPGTAFHALTVGATDEAVVSRIFYEYLGLATGMGPGQGLVMRPTVETRIVNFSSRGPLSDGRMGPRIAALGTWNFLPAPTGSFNWVTGTSFASPTVAGAAALLNAWWEKNKGETHPDRIRAALVAGADPRRTGPQWRDANEQGAGVLDVPAAFAKLKDRHPPLFVPWYAGWLTPNVLRFPLPGRVERHTSRTLSLQPGEAKDFVFEIGESTSAVRIDLEGIDVPDNSANAVYANALQVDLQSAKRSAVRRPVDTVLLDSSWNGETLSIDVEDGPWTLAGSPIANQTMEPGLMKLTLSGDFVNESPVAVRARIVRENLKHPLCKPIARLPLEDTDSDTILFADVPAGTARATFDLTWRRDWSRFPTSDIDLVLVSPSDELVLDGATLHAPERAVVTAPEAGSWLVFVDAFELPKPDVARLYLKLD